MYAGIFAIAKARNADTSTLAKRTLQLGVWMWITLQNVAQVGQAASPGLPPIIVSIYQPVGSAAVPRNRCTFSMRRRHSISQ
jgi:hypothetical protein